MCTEQNAHDQALHVALEHGHQAVVVPCVELFREAIPEVGSDIRKIVVGMGAALERSTMSRMGREKWGWEGGAQTILIRKLSPSSVSTLK